MTNAVEHTEGGKDAEHSIEEEAKLERLVFAVTEPAWNGDKIKVSLAGAPDYGVGGGWSRGHWS